MELRNYLHHARSLPPHRILKKAMARGINRLRQIEKRKWDERNATYAERSCCPSGELQRYLHAIPVGSLIPDARRMATLTDHSLSHRFDLLGSGCVQVRHGMSCRGIEGHRYEMGSLPQVGKGQWLEGRINPANLSEAKRLWNLVEGDYDPIDWHLDFKSGYRWSESTWYADVPHGHHPGVDIKVPWELARMQHLVPLAFSYGLSKSGPRGFRPPDVYVREFRNQVLDFAATNPPRFGVNWRCAMEVAVRAVNWLVAYDLFRGFGAHLDPDFETEFRRAVYDHGVHIFNNLEWSPYARGNHYLSNIVGLLFVAAYLPRGEETDTWLAFAAQQLIGEVEYQFSSEGTNFEASTNYHRFCAEMVLYATALVLGLPAEKRETLRENHPDPHPVSPKKRGVSPLPFYPLNGTSDVSPFPPWYMDRVEKMAEFTMHLTKPDQHVSQIGDHDSGRFLKLGPVRRSIQGADDKAADSHLIGHAVLPDDSGGWAEDPLEHLSLVAAASGLFDRHDFWTFAGGPTVEAEVVRQLAKGSRLPSVKTKGTAGAKGFVPKETTGDRSPLPPERPGLCRYPEFGVYVYVLRDLYLLIRCGSIGQKGLGGHAHNDNLSFELNLRGKDFFVDGGSYLYTAVPEIRNAFRSTRAHNTLSWNSREQNDWYPGLRGLFWMKDQAKARAVSVTQDTFQGEHVGYGHKHARSFRLSEEGVLIDDTFEADSLGEINFNLAPAAGVTATEDQGEGTFSLIIRNGEEALRLVLMGFDQVAFTEGYYSRGYGTRVRNQLLRCSRARSRTQVKIDTVLKQP